MRAPANAEALFKAHFHAGRTKRSEFYKSGVLIYLRNQIVGSELQCYHDEGTPEFDAFWAGVDEGRFIYSLHCRVR